MDSWFQVGKIVAGQQQQQTSSWNNLLPRSDVEDPKDALTVELPVNDDDKIDTFISSALGRLSFQERDTVYLELHGVDGAVEERPDMVRERLDQFDACLIKLTRSFPKQVANAYIQAAMLDSEYAQSFRLLVLRAVRFDVEQAADRFLRFWDMKMRLFGVGKLCKTITLEDLNKDDLKTMKAGFIQILPGRDTAGRAVAVLLPDFQTYEEPANFSRVAYYMIMSSLEDEDTQKKGVALVVYNVAGKNIVAKTDFRTVAAGAWMLRSLPFRVCGMHQCFDDTQVRVVINFLLRFCHEHDRARVKIHHGSHQEVVYALMTYGIPTELLPISLNGGLKRKNHLDWLKIREWQQGHPETPRIVVPSHSDVLFGRGKPFRRHVGNLYFTSLVEESLSTYLNNKEKTRIIEDLVDKIVSAGGRFLKQDGPGKPWLAVEHPQAKEKTAQSFRTRAYKLRQQRRSNDDTRGARRSFDEPNETDNFPCSNVSFSPIILPEERDSESYHGDAKRPRF